MALSKPDLILKELNFFDELIPIFDIMVHINAWKMKDFHAFNTSVCEEYEEMLQRKSNNHYSKAKWIEYSSSKRLITENVRRKSEDPRNSGCGVSKMTRKGKIFRQKLFRRKQKYESS